MFNLKIEGIEEAIKDVEDQKKAYENAIRKAVIELFRRVILKTPVDKGQARSNWQASINSPISSILNEEDPRGTKAINKMVNIVLGKKDVSEATFWLSNNLPYIDVLEYGEYPNPPKKGTGKTAGGYSIQAPTGMVRAALRELSGIIREVSSEL
jgi:hypothetical protein